MTDSGSDSTVAVALETDSTETFTPDVTKAVGTFAAASAAGTTKIRRLGPDDIDLRYSRLNFAVSGGNLTTGKFTGFLTTNIDKWRAYADNVTIS
jgi:hypothetical protein